MTGTGVPATAILELADQLDRTQWKHSDDIVASQHRYVSRLARHAAAHAPVFAKRLQRAGLTCDDLGCPEGLARLQPLQRREVQALGAQLHCASRPAGHAATFDTITSGSTGEPVVVRRTAVNALFFHAMTLRDLRWHRRDPAGRLCLVRAGIEMPERRESWGALALLARRTGPLLQLPVNADPAQLGRWIAEFAPDFLVIYPTVLAAIARYFDMPGRNAPRVRHIQTIGETLTSEVRAHAAHVFAAAVTDCYSSEEFGPIALQCPGSGLYHVMAESVLVEVVRDDGTPCRPGEAGRALITDIHNYAMPMIRYDIGDIVEVADPCTCGRGLPAWSRIHGRVRNLVLMPDGTRRWPVTGFPRCREVAPVVQYQLVQRERDSIEARLVVERPLTHAEEEALRGVFHAAIGHPFKLRLTYVDDAIRPGASGKHHEFLCELAG